MNVRPLSATALAAWLADPARPAPLLVDVREPWEFATCRIDGSQSIPLATVPGRLDDVDLSRPIVCVCHHGARSLQAAMFFAARGADDVHNLTGGVAAWASQVDPDFPTY